MWIRHRVWQTRVEALVSKCNSSQVTVSLSLSLSPGQIYKITNLYIQLHLSFFIISVRYTRKSRPFHQKIYIHLLTSLTIFQPQESKQVFEREIQITASKEGKKNKRSQEITKKRDDRVDLGWFFKEKLGWAKALERVEISFQTPNYISKSGHRYLKECNSILTRIHLKPLSLLLLCFFFSFSLSLLQSFSPSPCTNVSNYYSSSPKRRRRNIKKKQEQEQEQLVKLTFGTTVKNKTSGNKLRFGSLQ